MAKGKLLIRFWIIDEDTNSKKFGSRWFDVDSEREEMNAFLDEFPGRRFVEQSKYIYSKEKEK